MDQPQQEADPIVLAPGEGPQLNVLGDNQCVKLSGEQTLGALTLIETENMPGTAVPLHWHDNEDETFYVLQGSFEFTLDVQRMLLTEGSVVFVPRRIAHAWKVTGDGPARMLVILTPGGADRMFAEIADLCGDRGAPVHPPMEKIVGIGKRYGVHIEPPKA